MGFLDFFKKKTSVNNVHDLSKNEPLDKELKDEIIELIDQEIHFGFYNEAEIVDCIWAAGFEDEEQINDEWLQKITAERYKLYQLQSKYWNKPTDFEKLAHAFDQLNHQHIIALHRAGYTKQDGYADVQEVIDQLKEPNSIRGYCFYHTQDLERAIDPSIKNLYLAFDATTQDDETALAVAHTIIDVLRHHGLSTQWNGSITERIEITNINWQKTPDFQSWDTSRAIDILNQK